MTAFGVVLSPLVARYALLSAARELLLADFLSPHPLVEHRRGRGEHSDHPHRTTYCRRAVISDDQRVGLLHYPAQAAGGYSGLMTCSWIWGCVPCASKITERRREDYEAAFGVLRQDYQLAMLTLTLQHERGDLLVPVRDTLLWGYERLVSKGRPAVRFCGRWGIVGRARALEVTYGRHGWHPHLHLALVLASDVELDMWALQADAAARWTGLLAEQGGYASWAHGVWVTCEADLSYVVKLGFEDVALTRSGSSWSLAAELTKAPVKAGRYSGLSPQGLLAAYLTGGYTGEGWSLTGEEAGRLWLEYAAAMKGQRHVVPAGVLTEALGAAADKTDAALEAEEREIAVLLGSLSLEQWRVVLRCDLRGELQEVLGRGDVLELRAFLGDLGIQPLVVEGQVLSAVSLPLESEQGQGWSDPPDLPDLPDPVDPPDPSDPSDPAGPLESEQGRGPDDPPDPGDPPDPYPGAGPGPRRHLDRPIHSIHLNHPDQGRSCWGWGAPSGRGPPSYRAGT